MRAARVLPVSSVRDALQGLLKAGLFGHGICRVIKKGAKRLRDVLVVGGHELPDMRVSAGRFGFVIWRVCCCARRAPDGIGKMFVVGKAGNNVPMHVRHHVSQLRQIDFIGLEMAPLQGFYQIYGAHQAATLGLIQIGHFLRVAIEDDACKCRVIGLLRIDNAQECVAKQHGSAIAMAQRAISMRGHCRGSPGKYLLGESMIHDK